MADDAPAVLVAGEELLGWLLDHTARFPRDVRFTLSQRIDNLALDVYERLVEARYARERGAILRRVNLDLEKLRLLLRLATDRKHLPVRSLEHAATRLDHVGRMVGGWLRAEGAAP